MAIPNPMTSKKAHFVKELKIISKWSNMLDDKGNSNTKNDEEKVQTTRKPSRGRSKKANTF